MKLSVGAIPGSPFFVVRQAAAPVIPPLSSRLVQRPRKVQNKRSRPAGGVFSKGPDMSQLQGHWLFPFLLYLGAFLALWRLLMHLIFRRKHRYDERHTVRTADGVRLAAYRYLPRGDGKRRGRPFLIIHGTANSAWIWDVGGKGLAHYLADRGFEVWTADLRGHGRSWRAGFVSFLWRRFCLDDYVLEDFPALVEYVRKASGSELIDIGGYSQGGIALYGYLARVTDRYVGRAVSFAGPPMSLEVDPWMEYGSGWLVLASRVFPHFHIRAMVRWNIHLVLAFASLYRHIWNPANLPRWRAAVACYNGIDDLNGREARLMGEGILRRRILSRDGKFDYTAALERVETPILFLAGIHDRLAPSRDVEEAWRTVAAEEKEFVLFAKGRGHRADYGHFDLVLGDAAPYDVYPVVAEWLSREH